MRPYSKDRVSSPVIKKRNVSGKGPKGKRPKRGREAGGSGTRCPEKEIDLGGRSHSYLGLASMVPHMLLQLAVQPRLHKGGMCHH